jgi:CDP-diacylglycerol--serine O-phosphatidyltransferase
LKPGEKRGLRRGAALLPSLLTTANLFLGFWAIVKAFHGQFADAAPLVGWAIVLDMLDGRIARLTGTTSEFGGELDSLADAISFGMAPALLAYLWAFQPVPRTGWIAAFLFVMCGVFRLARFNVQRQTVDSRYFVGLPIPMAAAQLAALIHFDPTPVTTKTQSALVLGLVVTLSLLMVSTLRYRSFKSLDLKKRRSYLTVLGVATLLLPIALVPGYALLALASAYALSGPTGHLLGMLRRRSAGHAPVPTPANEAH